MSLETFGQSKSSAQLLQALQTELPYLSKLYEILEINIPRKSENTLTHITERFKKPSAIIVVGVLTTCFIVQRVSYREYDCIIIESETDYRRLKNKQLESIIYKKLNSNECIQSPLFKKLVFITDLEEMCGIIAYRKRENQLVIGENPLSMSTNKESINCKKAIFKFLDTRGYCK